MSDVAIDIVLLPELEDQHKAVEANRMLESAENEQIPLSLSNCIPHITVLMGCVSRENLKQIDRKLNELSREFSGLSVSSKGHYMVKNSWGKVTTLWNIDKDSDMLSLHHKVLSQIGGLVHYDVEREMFHEPQEVTGSTMEYVKKFIIDHGGINYDPHITIGYGELKDFDLPQEIRISEIAACQLGNHCTCRKVLASAKV